MVQYLAHQTTTPDEAGWILPVNGGVCFYADKTASGSELVKTLDSILGLGRYSVLLEPSRNLFAVHLQSDHPLCHHNA